MEVSVILMVILFFTVSLSIFMSMQLWEVVMPRFEKIVRNTGTNENPTVEPRLIRDTRLSRFAKLDRVLARLVISRQIQLLLSQAGLPLMVDQLLGLSILAAVAFLVAALIFGVPMSLAGMISVTGFALPLAVAFRKRHIRRTLFDQQLPDFLDAIAHAMQAGHSFSSAISLTCKDAPDPVGAEFRLVFEEINFGRPVQDGLQALSYRVNSDDVQYFVMAVKIHAQTGGNLSALLLNLSALIRDRQRLRKVGEVLSAEGRLSGWILGSLPFLTAFLIYTVNPEFLSILWREPIGIFILKITVAMMVLGVFWMWRLIHFRI